MSNKYTKGLDQRYIQAFQGKDSKGNVVGSFGRADRGRYDAYAKATKGLDKDLAFKSLGGSGWGKEDQGRYDTALAKRNKAQADAKAKADARAAKADARAAKADAKAKAQADAKAKAQADAKAKAQADAKAKAQAHLESTKSQPAPTVTESPAPTVTESPAPSVSAKPNTGSYEKAAALDIDTSQQQTVTQDNDIDTKIDGNQNTVNNNQDNSNRQYGGNNQVNAPAPTVPKAPAPSVSAKPNTGSYEKAVDKAQARINSPEHKSIGLNIDTSQQQTVTQDNDIDTTITGNQNTVVNNQDNSIRQYGGNTKVFNYQGGGNSGVDTPVSAATMSGFYDTDDSPAATAKFFDLHNTLFQDAQKKFSGKGNEIASSYRNFDARGYDAGKLDSRIENSKLRSYDRAILAKNDLFGDQDRYRGHLSEYKFGKGPDPIENK